MASERRRPLPQTSKIVPHEHDYPHTIKINGGGRGRPPYTGSLPRIVNGVGHDLLAVGCYFERKFYRLGIALL